MSKALLSHLAANEILIDSQHGFRRSRPCETQLVLFVDELVRSLHAGKQTDAVVDFSKAFDVVPHNSLLVKLSCYGIQNKTLDWIASFLADHSQRVIVDGALSEPAPVTSGVPQGSVLGPILFLVFINDMPEQMNSTCHLFADDNIVYCEVNSVDDTAQVHKDLTALEPWEKRWGMSLDPTKCKIINITRKKKAHFCSVLPERGASGKCPGGLVPRCPDCRQPHLA